MRIYTDINIVRVLLFAQIEKLIKLTIIGDLFHKGDYSAQTTLSYV